MTEIPEHLRKRAEEARQKAAQAAQSDSSVHVNPFDVHRLERAQARPSVVAVEPPVTPTTLDTSRIPPHLLERAKLARSKAAGKITPDPPKVVEPEPPFDLPDPPRGFNRPPTVKVNKQVEIDTTSDAHRVSLEISEPSDRNVVKVDILVVGPAATANKLAEGLTVLAEAMVRQGHVEEARYRSRPPNLFQRLFNTRGA